MRLLLLPRVLPPFLLPLLLLLLLLLLFQSAHGLAKPTATASPSSSCCSRRRRTPQPLPAFVAGGISSSSRPRRRCGCWTRFTTPGVAVGPLLLSASQGCDGEKEETAVVGMASKSSSSSSGGDGTNKKNKAPLYSFVEARKIARGHGFSSREEFVEYECPGAYQLPKNPEVVWEADWKGWDDWLGLPWDFETGRELARIMKLKSREEYLERRESKNRKDNKKQKKKKQGGADVEDDSSPPSYDPDEDRLPYRPDLYYKNDGWSGWDDWLGVVISEEK